MRLRRWILGTGGKSERPTPPRILTNPRKSPCYDGNGDGPFPDSPTRSRTSENGCVTAASERLSRYSPAELHLAAPYGTALVIAPWNYPFLLSLDPRRLRGRRRKHRCPQAFGIRTATADLLGRLAKEVFRPVSYRSPQGAQGHRGSAPRRTLRFIFFTGFRRRSAPP